MGVALDERLGEFVEYLAAHYLFALRFWMEIPKVVLEQGTQIDCFFFGEAEVELNRFLEGDLHVNALGCSAKGDSVKL